MNEAKRTVHDEEPLVAMLTHLAKDENRAALSALRRSLSPGAGAHAYPYVVPFFGRAPHPSRERTYLLVAGLFGLHPMSGSTTLAKGLRYARDRSKSDSIEKRFLALLDSHPDDLGTHLRHAVGLVRSHEIAIDWNDLLRTLLRWNESARRRWSRDFWAPDISNEGENE